MNSSPGEQVSEYHQERAEQDGHPSDARSGCQSIGLSIDRLQTQSPSKDPRERWGSRDCERGRRERERVSGRYTLTESREDLAGRGLSYLREAGAG